VAQRQKKKDAALAAARLNQQSSYDNGKDDASTTINPPLVDGISKSVAAKKFKPATAKDTNKSSPAKDVKPVSSSDISNSPTAKSLSAASNKDISESPATKKSKGRRHGKKADSKNAPTIQKSSETPAPLDSTLVQVHVATEKLKRLQITETLKDISAVPNTIKKSEPLNPIDNSKSNPIVHKIEEKFIEIRTVDGNRREAGATGPCKKNLNERNLGRKESKMPHPKTVQVFRKQTNKPESSNSINHLKPEPTSKIEILKSRDLNLDVLKDGTTKRSNKWGGQKQKAKEENLRSISEGVAPCPTKIIQAAKWKKDQAFKASRLAFEEKNPDLEMASVQLIETPSWDPRAEYHSSHNELWAWAVQNLRDSTRTRLLAPYLFQGKVPDRLLCAAEGIHGEKGKSFKNFNQLPTELRLQIWEHALNNAYYDVKLRHEYDGFGNGNYYGSRLRPVTTSPPLLHVCSESREVAIRRFEWTFGTKEYGPLTHFCYARDRLWLLTQGPHELPYMASLFLDADLRRIRRLVVPLRDFVKDSDTFCRSIVKFRHLQHLWLVVGNSIEDEIFSKDKQLLKDATKLLTLHWQACFKKSTRERKMPMVLMHVIDAVWAHKHGIDGIHW
jgi:hypothetical protein